jgi:Lrp/AsnC family leucine-responsive transcriptional regulator
MDDIDRQILEIVQRDSHLAHAEIGRRVGLSVSSVNERVRKLHRTGVVRAWSADVDPASLGLNLLAFIHIQIDKPERNAAFIKAATALPEVLECHHVTGEWNYLLKVRVHTTADLESLITNKLKTLRGVARSSTVIVLTSPKETSVLPVR